MDWNLIVLSFVLNPFITIPLERQKKVMECHILFKLQRFWFYKNIVNIDIIAAVERGSLASAEGNRVGIYPEQP